MSNKPSRIARRLLPPEPTISLPLQESDNSTTENNLSSNIEPSTSHVETSTSNDQPSTSHDQPSTSHDQTSSSHIEPSTSNNQTSSSHVEPSSTSLNTDTLVNPFSSTFGVEYSPDIEPSLTSHIEPSTSHNTETLVNPFSSTFGIEYSPDRDTIIISDDEEDDDEEDDDGDEGDADFDDADFDDAYFVDSEEESILEEIRPVIPYEVSLMRCQYNTRTDNIPLQYRPTSLLVPPFRNSPLPSEYGTLTTTSPISTTNIDNTSEMSAVQPIITSEGTIPSNVENSSEMDATQPISTTPTADIDNTSEMGAARPITPPPTSTSEDQRVTLDCAICLQKCVHPAKLPCSHIFCFLCLKGVAQTSRRCAMCRTPIPRGYLDNPDLVMQPELSVLEDGYQWFYEGRNGGWWRYEERMSNDIETNFNLEIKEFEVLICGQLYIINLKEMVQYSKIYPNRKRKMKRELINKIEQFKGVAGIH